MAKKYLDDPRLGIFSVVPKQQAELSMELSEDPTTSFVFQIKNTMTQRLTTTLSPAPALGVQRAFYDASADVLKPAPEDLGWSVAEHCLHRQQAFCARPGCDKSKHAMPTCDMESLAGEEHVLESAHWIFSAQATMAALALRHASIDGSSVHLLAPCACWLVCGVGGWPGRRHHDWLHARSPHSTATKLAAGDVAQAVRCAPCHRHALTFSVARSVCSAPRLVARCCMTRFGMVKKNPEAAVAAKAPKQGVGVYADLTCSDGENESHVVQEAWLHAETTANYTFMLTYVLSVFFGRATRMLNCMASARAVVPCCVAGTGAAHLVPCCVKPARALT